MTVVLGLFLLLFIYSDVLGSKVTLIDPNEKEVQSYTAALYLNRNHVVINPPIHASVQDSIVGYICGFSLYMRNDSIPVTLNSDTTDHSVATLSVKKNFTFSSTFYSFEISAFDCETPTSYSSRIPIYLKVENFEYPQFDSRHYSVHIAQTVSIGEKVIQVHATEAGNSSTICLYEISHPVESPFDINNDGVISLRRPLKQVNTVQHIVLRVSAIDCNIPDHHKASVSVNIVVVPSTASSSCNASWTGISKQVDYTVASGVNLFANFANIQPCNSQPSCVEEEAIVKLSLLSDKPTSKCRLDTASLTAQRDLCEINRESIDLLSVLPQKKKRSDSCYKDIEVERDNSLHPIQFNGSYEVSVAASRLPADHLLGNEFSIHFWLQHGKMTSHKKEQIICNSDKISRNRHHYSVFLHNCKLILLLRQEYRPNASNILKHAEWRYKLSEVCDGRWHHYALGYYAGQLKVYVDGRIFVHTRRNPQVMDDYVMKPSGNNSTQLTVGACWHSGRNKYQQHLLGALSGLVVLRGGLEPDRAFRCLNQCHEKLDFHAMSQMRSGMSLSLNSDMSMIEIKGHNLSEVQYLLRQIGYTNMEKEPTLGTPRAVRIQTTVHCRNPLVQMNVPSIDVHVNLVNVADHSVCLRGANLIRVPNDVLAAPDGIQLFLNLEVRPGSESLRLDSCYVWISPELGEMETLTWPIGEAAKSGVTGVYKDSGLLLRGVAKPGVYQKLLRLLRYRHRNPHRHYRLFNLTCSVDGGKYISNEFPTKVFIFYRHDHKESVKKQLPDHTSAAIVNHHNPGMDVLLDDIPLASAGRSSQIHLSANSHRVSYGGPHLQSAAAAVENGHHHLQSEQHMAAHNRGNHAAAGAITVIVIAVGLVLLVVGLLLYRRRRSLLQSTTGSPRKTLTVDAEAAEMEWDNTALNITVNPLEREDGLSDDSESDGPEEFVDDMELEGSSSSSDNEYDDEDYELGRTGSMIQSAQIASSEDELDDESCQMVTGQAAIQLQHQQLEWDDSSLPRPSPRRQSSLYHGRTAVL